MTRGALRDLSHFVFGTTRLGDESAPFDERVKVARAAMDAQVWFHTSHQYGDAFRVLRAAFDEDRAHVPPAIFKIGWSSIAELKGQIQEQLTALGLDRMPIGQLCLGEPLSSELQAGGEIYDGLRQLQQEGLVECFVLEVFPWTSSAAFEALRAGHADRAIDGYIFYFNPLQRFASNQLFDLLRDRDEPVVAMRTVGGGHAAHLRDNGPEYLRPRAAALLPIFERSGCASWTEFCVRYVFGTAQVRATVGSTARREHLHELLDTTSAPPPLDPELAAEIAALQREWADAHDMHAGPWSM